MDFSYGKLFRQINNIFEMAKSRGFFHIIISSSLVKVVSFISAIFLPRFLSKLDYGLLTYVDNISNYIMLINGLGIANATLRYCSKDEEEGAKKGYFIATLIIGVAFDIIIILLSLIAYILIPFPFKGAKILLLLMSFLPLFSFLFEDIQLLFRACFENQKYSILSFVYSMLMVVLQIAGAILRGLNGVAVARYVAVVICIIIGTFLGTNIKLIKQKMIFPSKNQMIKMIKFGVVILVTNATSMIMQLNETFIIGQVLKDQNALAEYKVAGYILQISLFLVQSVVIFVFPYFVKHMDDKQWIWAKFKKIFIFNIIVMLPLHIILIISSKLIVLILFGSKYLNAVPIMQMLLVASLGQAIFRGLTGNILTGIGEEKYNFKINIGFAILHAVIDIWAIKTFGITGAAVALTIVYFVSGIMMIGHLKKVCKRSLDKLPLILNR